MDPPRIRMILPLTREWADPDTDAACSGTVPKAAPLLLVLDERWYSTAGLAERLRVAVQTVDVPLRQTDTGVNCSDVVKETILEMSPDPLLSVKPGPSPSATVRVEPLIGPVAHTFDRALFPIVNASSFIIPPPCYESSGVRQSDFPWQMVRLRLQRTIHAPLLRESIDPSSLDSAWTDGVWVQYLPSFDLFGGISITAATKLTWDGANTFSLTDGPQRLVLRPTETDPSSKVSFLLFLVVTCGIVDIGGHPQETFVGVCRQMRDTWQWLGSPNVLRNGMDLRARVIEVQTRRGVLIESEASLWDRLFSADVATSRTDLTAELQRARIVRVSPPVYSRVVATNARRIA
jgi:hypothetical protein